MLINELATRQFPSQLKQAKIFSIFKGGPKTDPSNCRPISILPTISKIFEKHVNKHLMGYLNKHNLINKHQYGFRAKHSCQTALIKLIDNWMDSFLLRIVGLVFETWVVSFVFRNCLPFLRTDQISP